MNFPFFQKIKSAKWWLLGGASVVLISATGSEILFKHAKNLDLFASVVKEVNEYYVDPVSPTKLVRKGIDGMCKTLDPYTVLISENDITDYRFKTTGKYGGIGIEFGTFEDSMVIMSVYKDGAADKGSIKIGDYINAVSGTPIGGKSEEEISKMITGSPGTAVNISIRRPGANEIINKDLVREEVKVKSVPYFGMLNNDVGYIVLTSFTDHCSKEVGDAFADLKKNNPAMKGLVLDLRNNGGGLLNEAINIMNLFVAKNTLIVTTKGKLAESQKTYNTLNDITDGEMPLTILTNSQSASASEIVSGSMQDLERGIIVGQKTYGKGLVQVTRPISYGNQFKVTIAKYYTPSGRCIQVLDYGHRNADGSVGKVPDSLKHVFKTKAGRIVYDGGGIDPDVKTDLQKPSLIAKALEDKSFFFGFAIQYHLKHPTTTVDAKAFQLTDADFDDFVKYLSTKKYDYTSETEKQLDEFVKAADKEHYKETLADEIKTLEQKIKSDKTNDLNKHKKELLKKLNYEVVAFYYNQKGQTENAFQFDEEVIQAISVLHDTNRYKEILTAKK